MNRFYVYDKLTGKIVTKGLTAGIPRHNSETQGYVLNKKLPDNGMVKHDITTGNLVEINSTWIAPEDMPATWDDVKAKREELKRTPITTTKGVFDVDDVSHQNIVNAIMSFDAFKDPGLETGSWKLNDNSWISVSIDDLTEVAGAVVARAKIIHAQAEVINTGNYLVKDLDNLQLWGIS